MGIRAVLIFQNCFRFNMPTAILHISDIYPTSKNDLIALVNSISEAAGAGGGADYIVVSRDLGLKAADHQLAVSFLFQLATRLNVPKRRMIATRSCPRNVPLPPRLFQSNGLSKSLRARPRRRSLPWIGFMSWLPHSSTL